MPTFSFAIDATEIIKGRAYFSVSAATVEEARALLMDDASEHFTDFKAVTSETLWNADAKPYDFDIL